jgi:hypothetical protein
MCGVRTNVVTSVEIRDRHAVDTKSLPYLVEMTAESFVVREVSADKAYAQGEAPRSRAHKAPVTMVNEVLCKLSCHNICVLNQDSRTWN